MYTDALNRRSRFARPQATVKRLVLTEADFQLFEALQRHGPLPIHYLYAFTKDLRKDYTHLQNRLTEFYNGDVGGPYLTRPPQQFASFAARYQHLVYDLAPRARLALAEHDRLAKYTVRRSDPFVHQLMQACVGASIELTAPDYGVAYIHRETIFGQERCPASTKAAQNPLAIPIGGRGDSRVLIPDDLYGIRHPEKGYRFFAVEIDRNTESIERRDPGQTAFGKKISAYIEIMERQTFRTWWGIPNLSVQFSTTSRTHSENLADFSRQHVDPSLRARFKYSVQSSFGTNWCVPDCILSLYYRDLLATK